MRITGYRTVTTIQEWGRPVGDANGVFPDGIVEVQLVLVDMMRASPVSGWVHTLS